MTGEYQPEKPRFEDIALEGIREDDDAIDAEHEEIEAVSSTDGIDDFAIPDEPESYNSSLSDIEKLNRAYNEGRPLTDEEAAIEDRLATMAEYGPEMEMEAEYYEDYEDEPEAEVIEQKDRSELQFITPIDYAKRIEEMDADLRTTLEILISECSCYTPFKPFLMDIVASEYLFMPNKLEFLSDVVLDGKEERKRLSRRMENFGLELEESKSRLIEFGRYAEENRKHRGEGKPDTFTFLGFTHYCSHSKSGNFRVKRKTSKKKFAKKCKEVHRLISSIRHWTLRLIIAKLNQILVGYYHYYGITDNFRAIDSFRYRVERSLFYWLNRRSQKVSYTWKAFNDMLKVYPLARPQIYVSIYGT